MYTSSLLVGLRYRHIGVIGSVRIIHEIARNSDMDEEMTLKDIHSIKKRRQDMVS